MSKLQWFRLYHRIIDDEKIRLLAFEDRWHFIAICCLKADGLLDEPDSTIKWRKIAVKLGVQSRDLDEVRRRLQEVELIDDNMVPLAWDELQYTSDTSTERVRKHREKTKASPEKQSRNVSVTPPETETETEAEPAAREKSDFDALSEKLIEAVGEGSIHGHGALVVGPIIGLIEAGCDLETDILPTIRQVSSRLKRPAGSWTYFVPAIREAYEARLAAGRGVVKPPTPEASEKRWKTRLTMARDRGQWSTAEWGPAPGQPGSIVPKHLLQPGDGDGWREWQSEAA